MARIVILGSSGRGKSWYSGWFLERVVPKFEYAVYFDKEDEDYNLSADFPRGPDPLYSATFVDQDMFYEGCTINGTHYSLEELMTEAKSNRIIPQGLTTEEEIDLAGRCAKWAMEMGKLGDGCHVTYEEAHNVAPQTKLDNRISRLVTGGRKYGVEWIFVTQRPQKIHEDILSQSTHGIYFGMDGDRDLDKVDKSTATFDANIQLPKLEDRTCIQENKKEGEMEIINTETLERKRPHGADDPSKSDEVLEV